MLIQQAPDYEVKRQEDKALKLKKALYGCKQALIIWNSYIDKYLKEKGFIKYPYEHALYINNKDGDIMIVCLYVDDIIFTRSNSNTFEEFKQVMTLWWLILGLWHITWALKSNKQKKESSSHKKVMLGRYWKKKYKMDIAIP